MLQSETPKEMMGRVSAAAMSLQTFSMLVAPAAGAFLARMAGVSAVLIGAGIATFILGSIALTLRLKQGTPQTAVKNVSG